MFVDAEFRRRYPASSLVLLTIALALLQPAAAEEPGKEPEPPEAEEVVVYTNFDLEQRFGRAAPASRSDGSRKATPRGKAGSTDSKKRGIESAMAAAAARFQGKALKVAEGAAIWHPIRNCQYTGKYDVGSLAGDTASGSVQYLCNGWNKDTNRAFRTRVSWPVRFKWNGSGWTVVERE